MQPKKVDSSEEVYVYFKGNFMKFVTTLICLALVACNVRRANHTENKLPNVDQSIRQPLTDNMYVDVYTFIGRFLEENIGNKFSKQEIKDKIETERKNRKDPEIKPHIADMLEGETAGLLRVLLLKDVRYENITLYGSDGVGLATSGMRSVEFVFPNRPACLNYGFLTHAILSEPQLYHYKHNNNIYTERIYPIFKNDYAYFLEKKKGGILIGYVSYIVHE